MEARDEHLFRELGADDGVDAQAEEGDGHGDPEGPSAGPRFERRRHCDENGAYHVASVT